MAYQRKTNVGAKSGRPRYNSRGSLIVYDIKEVVTKTGKVKKVYTDTGERITKSEIAKFKKAVGKLQRARRKELKEEKDLIIPGFVSRTWGEAYKEKGETSKFVTSKTSGKLKPFMSTTKPESYSVGGREGFKRALKTATKRAKKASMPKEKRLEEYKKNYNRAVRKTFGDGAVYRAIRKKVNNMADFNKWAREQDDTITDIGYVYLLTAQEHRAIQLLKAVGYTDKEIDAIISRQFDGDEEGAY